MAKFRLCLCGILYFSTIVTLYGCSCDTIPLTEAIKVSSEIFVGKIIETKALKMNTHDKNDPNNRIKQIWMYKFEVDKKWKGADSEIVELYQEGNSCDYYFDIYSGKILVYANKYFLPKDHYPQDKFTKFLTGKHTTWLCSRTIEESHSNNKFNWFQNDIKILNIEFPTRVKLKRNTEYSKFIATFGIIGILVLLYVRMKQK